jgi:hypothetical protein
VKPLDHRQVPSCTPLVLVKLLYGPPTCPARGGIVHVIAIEHTATPDAAGLSIKCTTPRYHGPHRTAACHCFSKMVCPVCKLERTRRAELAAALQLVGILPVAAFLCKVCNQSVLIGHLLTPSRFTIVPAIVAGPVLLKYLPYHRRPKQALTTEQVITQALTDLDVIHTLIPHLKIEESFPTEFTWSERRRLFAFLTVPYLSITYIVPVPVLIASFGTFFLTWRSPWFRTTRRVIMRSAHMRALYRHAAGFISGNYSVPLTFSKFKTGTTRVGPELEKRVKHHRFLFTTLENQRWWVGIDWTAALLPSERPSWSAPATAASLAQGAAGNHAQTQALHPPLPPPSSFPLPPSTSVILPSPLGTGYVKRTAKWQWEDGSDWEVIVHKEGESASKRFRPSSISKSPQPGGTGAAAPEPEEGRGSRFLKGHLSKLNIGAVTSSPSLSSPPAESGAVDGDDEKAKVMSEDDESLVTDPEGWIYGDNKWENLSGKNAMGKVYYSRPKYN